MEIYVVWTVHRPYMSEILPIVLNTHYELHQTYEKRGNRNILAFLVSDLKAREYGTYERFLDICYNFMRSCERMSLMETFYSSTECESMRNWQVLNSSILEMSCLNIEYIRKECTIRLDRKRERVCVWERICERLSALLYKYNQFLVADSAWCCLRYKRNMRKRCEGSMTFSVRLGLWE